MAEPDKPAMAAAAAALMLGARLRVIYGRFASPAACTALSRAQ